MKQLFTGVYRHGGDIYTRNAVPGSRVNDERLMTDEGIEYRRWDPSRSKLGAAIQNGLPDLPIQQDSAVLYLGAASGTTPSHVAEIASEGIVFGVEYSPKVIRDLVSLAEERKRIAPILGDAREPEEYAGLVGNVDTIVQDVAQPDQARIAALNAEHFLKDGGHVLLAVKARSISSSRPVDDVFDQVREELGESFSIEWEHRLEPYERDHLFLSLEL